jgi:hypothetical protein
MTDKTLRERQQALRDRRARLGLVRVEVWVPAQLAERVRAYAKRLTARAEKGEK